MYSILIYFNVLQCKAIQNLNLVNLKTKQLYKILCTKKFKKTRSIQKLQTIYDLGDYELQTAFNLPRYCLSENQIKDFQYKILHSILPTNRLLFQMSRINSDRCTFCALENETVEHLFFECMVTKNFWFSLCNELGVIVLHIDKRIAVLGTDLTREDKDQHIFKNRFLLYVRYFIWQSKCINKPPSVEECIQWLKSKSKVIPELCCLFR